MWNDETTPARSVKSFIHSTLVRNSVFILLALLALVVRLPQLGERPMHTDEAVNAYIVGDVLDGQTYEYDPQDKHGPLLFALAAPVVRLCGAKHFSDLTETQLRLTPAIFSALAILLFAAGVRTFGFIPCLVGAGVFAIAPMPVYYSRYFIHETIFIGATLGLLLFGWRMLQSRSLSAAAPKAFGAAALTGLFAALALAGKETIVINFIALAFTGGVFWLAGKSHLTSQAQRVSCVTLAVAAGVFLVVTILLFTWGGRHWDALADLFRAVPLFTARASGQGHEKSFHYYFGLLGGGWSGAVLMALALAGCCRTWMLEERRWLVIYAVSIAVIYSAIPYKTPWLGLNLLLPLSILAGIAVEGVWNSFTGRAVRLLTSLALACIVALIAFDTRRLVFTDPAAENNPYAYAHTIPDVLRLPDTVKFHADKLGNANPVIAVVAEDPWPLPWYLRKFPNVGFWQPEQQTGEADFFITTTEPPPEVLLAVQRHRPDFFGVRPNVLLILWSPVAPSGSHE